CNWRGYSGEKYELMKKYDFWYFCNVDSAQYWVQIRDGYLRQGRINADGERMVKTPEKLTPFFDVDSVFDKTRPKLDL
ncbi:MAG: polysaccharide deacetylase, partial [Lachnospiraceae bacterium]|nr:polysaccharide deacetylase [Lachnospiraceae bacterium]